MAYDIAGALQQFNPMNAYAQGAQLGQQAQERRQAQQLAEGRKQYGRNAMMGIDGQLPSLNAYAQAFAEDAARAGDFEAFSQAQKSIGGGAEFGMNPQQGVDPSTGKLSYFVTNKQGQPRFLGIEAQPKPMFQGGFQLDPATGQPIAELPMNSKERAMLERQGQQLQMSMANLGLTQQRMQTEMQDKAQKQQLETQARENDRREAAAATDIAMDSLNTLTQHPGLARGTGSLIAPIARNIPGTDAKGFAAQLEQFKSQTFLPAVQQMKGMGQLSNAEGAALQKAVGNLDPDMPTAELQRQAAKIMAQMRAYRQRKFGDLPATTWGGNAPAASNAPKPGTVKNGYLFRGGDPADPKSWSKTR